MNEKTFDCTQLSCCLISTWPWRDQLLRCFCVISSHSRRLELIFVFNFSLKRSACVLAHRYLSHCNAAVTNSRVWSILDRTGSDRIRLSETKNDQIVDMFAPISLPYILYFERSLSFVAAVVRWSLCRGTAHTRSASGSRRQVPTTSQAPAPEDHLGRRADGLLFEGAIAQCTTGLFRSEPLPDARREACAGSSDWFDADTDRQLVQESAAERPLVAEGAPSPSSPPSAATPTTAAAALCDVVAALQCRRQDDAGTASPHRSWVRAKLLYVARVGGLYVFKYYTFNKPYPTFIFWILSTYNFCFDRCVSHRGDLIVSYLKKLNYSSSSSICTSDK